MCRSIGAQAPHYFDGVQCLFIHVCEGVAVFLHPGDLFLPLGYFYSKSNEGEVRVFLNAWGY